MTLARFGHHPNPAVDFCCECDVIDGLIVDLEKGLVGYDEVSNRLTRAIDFQTGGDEWAVAAKRKLEIYADQFALRDWGKTP